MASFIHYQRCNTIGDSLFLGFAIPDSEGKNALGILYGGDQLFPSRILLAIKKIKKT